MSKLLQLDARHALDRGGGSFSFLVGHHISVGLPSS